MDFSISDLVQFHAFLVTNFSVKGSCLNSSPMIIGQVLRRQGNENSVVNHHRRG